MDLQKAMLKSNVQVGLWQHTLPISHNTVKLGAIKLIRSPQTIVDVVLGNSKAGFCVGCDEQQSYLFWQASSIEY
ncbi:hypothetical protein RO3G_03351 [Rhizopus delemar RA 99-880]|uniref:Uncharacterized protein n=1 Tax=Rhizopus delemar (strain RA 99-880 / ATCC MYA-4621 / FGSC 9543 / NRRL 43880) TaxID=246409 RepID=I1BR17_RHIO9|nr:hypothetical protein RO3G_03351 [Rhizopus delemar RA 99-880]|eukprot:EIE78647.1 hypothetical protein RO3G_03351 [Rhizopus delemar RA 99-880]